MITSLEAFLSRQNNVILPVLSGISSLISTPGRYQVTIYMILSWKLPSISQSEGGFYRFNWMSSLCIQTFRLLKFWSYSDVHIGILLPFRLQYIRMRSFSSKDNRFNITIIHY